MFEFQSRKKHFDVTVVFVFYLHSEILFFPLAFTCILEISTHSNLQCKNVSILDANTLFLQSLRRSICFLCFACDKQEQPLSIFFF